MITQDDQQLVNCFENLFKFQIVNGFHSSNRVTFKGCVHFIFTGLFCMSMRELFRNNEKCFLFHFESSFCSWGNQVLTFKTFEYRDVIKWLSIWNTKHILLNKLGSNTVWEWNLASFVILQKKIFVKKLYEKCSVETSFGPF